MRFRLFRSERVSDHDLYDNDGDTLQPVEPDPDIYKGTFFISLGLSLLASAIVYLIEGVRYLISGRSGTN
jgi:hypothetical protein